MEHLGHLLIAPDVGDAPFLLLRFTRSLFAIRGNQCQIFLSHRNTDLFFVLSLFINKYASLLEEVYPTAFHRPVPDNARTTESDRANNHDHDDRDEHYHHLPSVGEHNRLNTALKFRTST